MALNAIGRIYRTESEAKRSQLTPDAWLAVRLEEAKPLFDELHLWLCKKASQVTPKRLLGIAVRYASQPMEPTLGVSRSSGNDAG